MNYGEFLNELNVLFPETTPEMAEKFRAMEGLYNDWNAKINVISRKDIGSLYVRHVLHSLAIAGYLKAVHVAGDSYVISIPNGEVRRIVSKMLSDDVGAESKGFREFSNAVLKGDVDSMEKLLGEILCQGSYPDFDRCSL